MTSLVSKSNYPTAVLLKFNFHLMDKIQNTVCGKTTPKQYDNFCKNSLRDKNFSLIYCHIESVSIALRESNPPLLEHIVVKVGREILNYETQRVPHPLSNVILRYGSSEEHLYPLVEMLIRLGANVNLGSKYHLSIHPPLQHAINFRMAKLSKLLLRNGAALPDPAIDLFDDEAKKFLEPIQKEVELEREQKRRELVPKITAQVDSMAIMPRSLVEIIAEYAV